MSSYLDAMRNGDFEIIPAYGRDYTTIASVRADWDANKDFKVRANPGMTVSRSTVAEFCNPDAMITIRFNKGRCVIIVRAGE